MSGPVRIERARRSDKTGHLICSTCRAGYACEDPDSAYFGRCSICYRKGLTRRELRVLGLKRP